MSQAPSNAALSGPGPDFAQTRPGGSAGTPDGLYDLAGRFAVAAERAVARCEVGAGSGAGETLGWDWPGEDRGMRVTIGVGQTSLDCGTSARGGLIDVAPA